MVIVRELREAWRRLMRRPGYALLSILVLGIGLGFVVFLFGAINVTVLEPYPFPQAERLVTIGQPDLHGSSVRAIDYMDSDQYLALKGKLAGLDRVGAATTFGLSVDLGHGGVLRTGAEVTPSVLSMLGAKPLLGRSLAAGDAAVGASRVIVLGESFWRHALGANPKVIGTSVRISGRFYTVVGVLPKAFRFPPQADFWMPLRLQPGQHDGVRVIGRLARGVDVAQARAELDGWAGRLKRLLPLAEQHDTHALVIGPLSLAFTPQDLRHWLWIMFGAGVLVLLLAAINVANLEWVKATRRRHELALRSALGCSRWRLMAGPLAESWIVGAAALAVAFAVAWGLHQWLSMVWINVNPSSIPYRHGLFNARLVIFGVVVAFVTTTLASGLPAWRASRRGLEQALRDETKGTSRGFARVTRALVVGELVLTVVLLVGAGTFVRAMHQLLAQPHVGATHATHVLTANVDLPVVLYPHDTQRIRFFKDVVAKLQGDAEVVVATASNTVPGAILGSHEYVSLPGHGEPDHGWPRVQMGVVGPGFLHTYDVKLLSGRFFDARDTATSHKIIVIDARTAARFWPHQNALGRQLVLWPGRPQARTLTVVGVIQTLQLDSPLNSARPAMLLPLAQAAGQSPLHDMGLAVRVRGNAIAFLPQLTNAVHAVDPDAALYRTNSQAGLIVDVRAGLTILTQVFTALGLVALLLAAAGLYGVLAYSVAQRTREIGIRRAIGAGHGAIVRTLGRQLVWQLGLGVAIGVALAWPWSNLLAGADAGLGLQAHDPAVFVTVIVAVVLVSLLATLVPTLRALRVDPGEALRHE